MLAGPHRLRQACASSAAARGLEMAEALRVVAIDDESPSRPERSSPSTMKPIGTANLMRHIIGPRPKTYPRRFGRRGLGCALYVW